MNAYEGENNVNFAGNAAPHSTQYDFTLAVESQSVHHADFETRTSLIRSAIILGCADASDLSASWLVGTQSQRLDVWP